MLGLQCIRHNFRGYNESQLRTLEWRYLIVCYGLPLVPAIVLLFIENGVKGRVYGPAILWCWIRPSWAYLRFVLVYGPAWFMILLSLTIYTLTGKKIFLIRQDLRKVQQSQVLESTRSARSRQLAHTPSNNTNKAAWAYSKYAVLYFVSALITWVTATVNRLYAIIKPSAPNFGLNFVEALLLPLQGFWTCMIFIAVSFSAVKIILKKRVRIFSKHVDVCET
ncbi:hypothetical protein N7510_005330 [Penicillium lagena]|uniref:uncharacterized protein n=1 Tax=Penicillium lagena TaxID=94218 RepID=UPI002540E63E|nr:uncharacterized protein N7510_005330 [Penicillium lagena]KAJ5612136.1 hypothetical protein N7510_005330 [Penicillium lagena]